ncbi:hypothetical protein X945_5886 [Burkholderia pseudomallei ABCPW 107]|nr:hypothetical protein X977_5757 [Burkholderia pseudomallei MSHR7504]KGS35003.1 hypothetical protein X945_5886 [Burkholderia pseudomallei ABCPW 107]
MLDAKRFARSAAKQIAKPAITSALPSATGRQSNGMRRTRHSAPIATMSPALATLTTPRMIFWLSSRSARTPTRIRRSTSAGSCLRKWRASQVVAPENTNQ